MRAVHTLYAASASLDGDEEDIMWLSTLLPSPTYLCGVIEHQSAVQGDETVHFVRCVGRELYVFWVPDVTMDEAAAIRAACEPIRKWGVEAFSKAVGRALGAKVQRLQ